MKKEITLLVFILLSLILSCKNFVSVDPPATSVSSKLVFTTFSTANSAVAGLYSKMAQSNIGFASGSNSITALCGLSADELINYSTTDTEQAEFFNNQVNPINSKIQAIWAELYNYIYSANVIIEGLNASTGIAEPVKNKLAGEALFIRAFCHFYLVNLFGDVPVILTSDYQTNSSITRSPSGHVYTAIISDLLNAQGMLDNTYIDNQKTRANKAVVTALLARVYLYHQEWKAAAAAATLLIEDNTYRLEPAVNDVFLIPSRESIWQLQSVIPQYNTYDGLRFILTGAPTNVSLRPTYTEVIPSNDARSSWIGQLKAGADTYYYPFKYKVRFLAAGLPSTEYLVVLRLSEQYLIRAEALAHLDETEQAKEDLDAVRKRAGLDKSSASDQSSLLPAIEQERRAELFAEWGHRWFDLKRTNRSDAVLGAIKPGWKPSAINFPIPESEIQKNPKL